MRRVLERSHTGHRWRHLLEQFELFPSEPRGGAGRPGDVPAWLGQAADKPLLDRIEGARKDDGDGGGRLPDCPCRDCSEGHEDIDLETHQLRRVGGKWGAGFSP
jgi:hypothetical protein